MDSVNDACHFGWKIVGFNSICRPVPGARRPSRRVDNRFNLLVAAGAAAKKLNLKSTDRGIDGAEVDLRMEKQKVEGSKKQKTLFFNPGSRSANK